MRVCIISNGPSANLYQEVDPREVFQTTIGVNKAVAKWKLDWWVFNDPQTFNDVDCIGKPKLFTRRQTAAHMKQLWTRWPSEKVIAEDTGGIPWPGGATGRRGMTREWHSYSGQTSLGLAMYLKATEVVVYGVDLDMDIDFTGSTHGHRAEPRWSRERKSWDYAAAWLAKHRGMTIIRHTMKGDVEVRP